MHDTGVSEVSAESYSGTHHDPVCSLLSVIALLRRAGGLPACCRGSAAAEEAPLEAEADDQQYLFAR